MRIIAGKLREEWLDRDTHLRAKDAAAGNFPICQHAPGNGKRYTCIQSSGTDAPTAIGQDNHLVGDLYLLPVGLACSDNAEHVTILRLNILNGCHLQEPGQDFTRRHLYSPYIDWLIASKADIYQELQFRQEIAGKSDFE